MIHKIGDEKINNNVVLHGTHYAIDYGHIDKIFYVNPAHVGSYLYIKLMTYYCVFTSATSLGKYLLTIVTIVQFIRILIMRWGAGTN